MNDKKAYLIVLDGFGWSEEQEGNAILQAKTPFIDKLFKKYPYAKLKTDGESVGLPDFQTGGSEVGHITMSAGRQIPQLLKKINDTIEAKSFFEHPDLKPLFTKAKAQQRIHFMGLCSDGGIHSYLKHLFRLQQMAKHYEIDNVYIHAFLDGRDVGERTAKEYLKQIDDQGIGKIATLGGRYFGMDRDTNWDRTAVAYQALCDSSMTVTSSSWQDYLDDYYKNSDKSDYYVPPVLFDQDGQIQAEDIVIFFNYRTDRARQISQALCDSNFSHFKVPIQLPEDNYAIFGPYYDGAVQPFSAMESEVVIDNTLGEIVSKAGGKQLRISETEKFNHVTFFFSGQQQQEFPGETRILIPSPKCPSYAEKPEMSAREQTEAAIKAISENDFQLVVQNYANPDLVGHSADLEATITAMEVVDKCLAELIPAALEQGFEVFLTGDHGNAEEMIKEDQPNAAHSKNRVPFFYISKQPHQLKELGDLGDVTPTILEVFDLPKTAEMTGNSLIAKSTKK